MSKEKKNRFYYSFSQECISQGHREIDNNFNKIEGIRENYVLTPNGWEKYTEWCSQEGSKCNWEDARLIFETNDSPKIKIEYRKTTQLVAKETELALAKVQLSEKDKKIENLQDENRALKEELIENDCMWEKVINELKQQLENEKKRSKKLNQEAQKYYEDAYCNDFQNQKAIAELEGLKNYLPNIALDISDMVSYGKLLNKINQQISNLKGEIQ